MCARNHIVGLAGTSEVVSDRFVSRAGRDAGEEGWPALRLDFFQCRSDGD